MVNSKLGSIKRNSDFLLLKKSGKKIWASPWLLLVFKTKTEGDLRVGITVSRKVGNAVVRNKLKRWSKEYFRGLKKSDPDFRVDINVVFRPTEPDLYKAISHEVFLSCIEKGIARIR